MMSLRSTSMILIACFTLIGYVKSIDDPDNMFDFLSVFNGNCDDKDQIESGFVDHDFVELRQIPVDIPVLHPANVVYMEQAVNGVVHIRNLCVISAGKDNAIYVTRYNITTVPQYKFGQLDPATLSNVTLADLQGDPNCVAVFERDQRGVYMGSWPDCKHTISGEHPSYAAMYACKKWSCVVPIGVTERTTRVPYECTPKGERYPLINAPANYMSPCETKE